MPPRVLDPRTTSAPKCRQTRAINSPSACWLIRIFARPSNAVGKSNADMVTMLIDAGADPTVKMDDEVTLLEFAILSEQPAVAAKLRKAGLPEPGAERIKALRKAATEP